MEKTDSRLVKKAKKRNNKQHTKKKTKTFL